VADFETINPLSLKEALSHVGKNRVVPIAGGTDLLVRLHDLYDYPWPKLLVLDRIKPLHKIDIKNNKITLGPLVTFTEIMNSSELKKYAPQLTQAASVAGSVQIRNRATIGGNLANGSPSGDLIPPLYVLDAKLELTSAKAKRLVPIAKFFIGPGKTILHKNELITAIYFAKSSGHGFFDRLATRKALAISKVSVAADIAIQRGKVVDARIALGAVAPTVIRAPLTEEHLIGKELSEQTINEAANMLSSEARPIDDIRSLAEYRREMVGVLLKRGIANITNGHKATND
jgi:CO/xanthine dehydrogenase FAD-binding subunit